MEGRGLTRAIAVSFELGKWIALLVIGLLMVHYFIATVFVVDGVSMEPNLRTGQILLVNKLAYLAGSPRRGDIVVLRYPGDPKRARYVKRIVALPKETVDVQNGKLYVNSRELREVYLQKSMYFEAEVYSHYRLKDGEYFMFGDNRPASSDSRIWGPAKKEDLIGRARFILYPFSSFGYVPDVYY